jgi:RNA polymerase sigma-70 factor (ECF subfamily)
MRFEEKRLAREAATGDEKAFSRLYAMSAPRVRAFVRALTRSLSCAEAEDDIIQETYLASLSSLSAYRGDAGLCSFLCAIAKRKAIDAARRSGAERARRIDGTEPDELTGKTAGTEAPVIDAETRASARAVLALLPEAWAQALSLRYAQGKGVPDVAEALGLGYKAAESLLARARTAFKKAWKRTIGGEMP